MNERFAALDLGSGTIKLSVFEQTPAGWRALCLEEANTELRKGMGEERTLKAGPLAETLAACEAFQRKARELGAGTLPAYATSAVRKAKNPEALVGPLKAMGIDVRVLTEDEEGRWNYLGATARVLGTRPEGASLRATDTPRVGPLGVPSGTPLPVASRVLVIDPGGDSTESTGDVSGEGWESAVVASLPFGSVSLQEAHGSAADNEPIPWQRLEAALEAAKGASLGHPNFSKFVGAGFVPAIRMNYPIQRALEGVNVRPLTAHGEGGLYTRDELAELTRQTALLDHAGRAALLEGEPIGKVDRTCYGFASWLGILDALQAKAFTVEPWGIKLGAVIALNPH